MIGKPIELAECKSDASKHFMGPRQRFAHFLNSDDSLLPTGKGKNWQSASLTFRIAGGNQCPTIRLKVVIEDPKTRNANPIHEAELVFPRGSIQEVKAYQSEDLKIEEFLGVTSDAGHLVVEFSTSGGIGLRLNVRDPRFDTATVNLRGLLEQWTENEPEFHQTQWSSNMRIFVYMSKKDGETN